MRRFRSRNFRRKPRPATRPLLVASALAWGLAAVVFGLTFGPRGAWMVLGVGLASLLVEDLAWRRLERKLWLEPVRDLSRNLAAFNDAPGESWNLPATPMLAELIPPVQELQRRYVTLKGLLDRNRDDSNGTADSGEINIPVSFHARMTQSGTYEPPEIEFQAFATGEFSTLDMISRLEPRSLRWLESSQSEQDFLGWSIVRLREKSFLDVVHEDDRELARQQFRSVLAKGEGHGLIYRIMTAKGETRAVELNVGVRYGPDRRVLHLRCHLTDITAKLRDESELRRRTLELIQANDQLRRANRELGQLKDRYGDLYQNAPAMYFTVDRHGRFQECNDTLVRTLGHDRNDLLGQPCTLLLAGSRTPTASDKFLDMPRSGSFEFESEWAKLDGETIFVWVTGTAISGTEGKIRHFRCVAQDITARRSLEAELQVKNERLALANAELSRKNKELDEFTYVVSHDLQEPLRTLIAFSDFLMRDQGDRLDDSGREYVRYLVEASRRLRALIQDLLSLSRAGKVTSDFEVVNLNDVVEVIKADHAELIRSRGGKVQVVGPMPFVWGDRDRIGQLLANLVGNGLKYNQQPEPSVEVSAEETSDGRSVEVCVVDNGIGIDPQFHAKIFQLFRRLHTREEYEGTGAGLAICQKIVHAHGGRLWVESEAGQGARFHVTLPRPPAGLEANRTAILHAP